MHFGTFCRLKRFSDLPHILSKNHFRLTPAISYYASAVFQIIFIFYITSKKCFTADDTDECHIKNSINMDE